MQTAANLSQTEESPKCLIIGVGRFRILGWGGGGGGGQGGAKIAAGT